MSYDSSNLTTPDIKVLPGDFSAYNRAVKQLTTAPQQMTRTISCK